jgi:hypothetical protein
MMTILSHGLPEPALSFFLKSNIKLEPKKKKNLLPSNSHFPL